MELVVLTYSGIPYGNKNNKPQIYAIAWMNLINIMVNQIETNVWFLFIENLIGRLICGYRSQKNSSFGENGRACDWVQVRFYYLTCMMVH